MSKRKLKKDKVELDPFESELERSFVEDEWTEVTDTRQRRNAMAAAKSTKSERTNIRLSLEDAVGIKRKAREYGLGYQTLISSIVHQYVIGKLVEADDERLAKLVAQTVKQLGVKSIAPSSY